MLEHTRNTFIFYGCLIQLCCCVLSILILWPLIYRNVTTFVRNYRKNTSETWLKPYLFPRQTNISSKRWAFKILKWYLLFFEIVSHCVYFNVKLKLVQYFFWGGMTRFHRIWNSNSYSIFFFWGDDPISPHLWDFNDG